MSWMTTRRRDRGSVPGKGTSISIEKAWHGLHYLLCGEVEPGSRPLSQAILGGAEVGEDMGYGPARYFTLTQVAGIADELNLKLGIRVSPRTVRKYMDSNRPGGRRFDQRWGAFVWNHAT